MSLPEVVWRDERIPMLVLGAAQLGLPGYGVANTTAGLTRERAAAIVQAAWRQGVRFFDTAQAYGDSEQKLGHAFRQLNPADSQPRVMTKLDPALDLKQQDIIAAGVARSRENLGLATLWGLLLHRFDALRNWGDGLGSALKNARRDGVVRHLGVSVYTVPEALEAIEHPDMDIIQLPANAWDDRIVSQGVLDAAKQKGKLLFVRSVFLQGLLLLKPAEIRMKVPGAKEASAVWWRLCQRFACSPLELALDWARELNLPLVIGAESAEQVGEIANCFHRPAPMPGVFSSICFEMAAVRDEEALDPRRWRQ